MLYPVPLNSREVINVVTEYAILLVEKVKEVNNVPLISVIISTYNDEGTIGECLRTLTRQCYPRYEIVLVNDGSVDGTLEVIQDRKAVQDKPKIKLISYDDNRGVPIARNIGMKNASGDIYVFSDADCVFERDWLSKLIAPLLTDPQIGCTGGPDRVPDDETILGRCIDYTMRSVIATGGVRGSNVMLARYSPSGCNFAVRRDVIDEVGMHDEHLRYRGEEKELEYRIRRAGYRIVYVKEAFVWHRRRATLAAFWKQTFLSGKARIDILRVAPRAVEPAHIFPFLFSLATILGAIFSLFSSSMRVLWSGGMGVYFCLIFAQSVMGCTSLGDIRALGLVPLITMMIHFGYGLGSLWRIIGYSWAILRREPNLS